jgi:hypothetical protein
LVADEEFCHFIIQFVLSRYLVSLSVLQDADGYTIHKMRNYEVQRDQKHNSKCFKIFCIADNQLLSICQKYMTYIEENYYLRAKFQNKKDLQKSIFTPSQQQSHLQNTNMGHLHEDAGYSIEFVRFLK